MRGVDLIDSIMGYYKILIRKKDGKILVLTSILPSIRPYNKTIKLHCPKP